MTSRLQPERQPGLTDVIVWQPLQEAGLVAAGRGLDAGCQGAEVGLADVEQEVSGRAQLHLRAPSAVIWETPQHSPIRCGHPSSAELSLPRPLTDGRKRVNFPNLSGKKRASDNEQTEPTFAW